VESLSEYETAALADIKKRTSTDGSRPRKSLVPNSMRAFMRGGGEVAVERLRRVPGYDKAENKAGLAYIKAAQGLSQATIRAAQLTLSEDRMLMAYAKRGHELTNLSQIRDLDLELVEKVRPKFFIEAYAAAAAMEGGAAGFAISGGEALATVGSVASAGAAAAPSLGLITSTVAIDAAFVLGMCSRAVAHTALYYGYDPNETGEQVFAMSVINLGSSLTQSGKYSAYVELSKVTQDLARGATWTTLNRLALPRIAERFARAFGVRLTKQKLGQFVPVFGVLAGGGINYWLLNRVSEAAYWAYRERFINEKLGIAEMSVPEAPEPTGDEFDEPAIDVIDLLNDDEGDGNDEGKGTGSD